MLGSEACPILFADTQGSQVRNSKSYKSSSQIGHLKELQESK